MTITLQLTPEMEARLQKGVADHDPDTVRQVLHDAVEPTVKALLAGIRQQVTPEEFENILAEMAQIASEALPPGWQGLSDYAVSREGIYEDHP